MIRHFLLTAFRHFYRTRAFGLINISGFAIGIMVALLLYIWMDFENSYDQFHTNKDQIYRIINGEITDENAWVGTPAPLADHLNRLIPDISAFLRMNDQESILQANEKTFSEKIHSWWIPIFLTCSHLN
jgi:putative ABC transport system permease protein